MWLIANVIHIENNDFIGHCLNNRVYRELDKAEEKLKQVKTPSNNYKLFKVMLQEVEGNGSI